MCSLNQDEIVSKWKCEIEKPLVSIVCIAYNHEKYICNTINSFLEQETTFPFEIIIHDDASTDKTTEIIKSFEEKYPRIIQPIYQKENKYSKGIVIFIEEIYKHINGEFVAFCEGDDYWCDCKKLQKSYDYIINHPECEMVSHLTEVLRCDLNKRGIFNPFFLQKGGIIGTYDILLDANLIHCSSQFYRKSLIDKNFSFFKNTSAFDMDFVMLAATEGYIYVIPEIMSVYRYWTSGSWSSRIDDDVDEKKLYNFLLQARKVTENLNEYRDYKYNDILSERVRRISFHLLQLEGKLKDLKKTEYLDLYKKLSFFEKVIISYKGFPIPFRRFIRKHIRPIFLKLYLLKYYFSSDKTGFSNFNR